MTHKSIAQRALDATYPAEQLSSCVSAAYWLASCHEDQATVMAIGRMQEAEERLAAIAEAMGFKIERVSEPSARVEEYTDAEAVNGSAEWKSVEDDFWADAPGESEVA